VYNVQGTPVEIQTTVTPNSLWCSPFQGSVDATISGGTTPYTYEWSNGSTTEDISNLWPNLFWLRVTDANGCSTISDWILVPWGQVPEVVGQVTPSCFGVGTGAIDIDVSGGSPPYTFDWWSGGGFTSTAEDLSGLSSNGYILDITDANGCSAQYSFYVPLDEDYMELSATVTNTASCGQGGAIDLSVIGGQVPYVYQWGWQPGGSASTEDIADLYSGTYHVQVTDEIGCRVWGTFVVPGSPKTVDLVSSIEHTCPGFTNGMINITMTGGVAPYNFSWNGPGGFFASTEDISGLAPGTYTLLVQDANSCTAFESFTILGVVPFELSAQSSGCPPNVGNIDLTVTGQNAPYSFLWSNGAITEDLIGVPLGIYTVTVTDASGCTATMSHSSKSASGISLSFSSVNPTCANSPTGSINLSITGGLPPYLFSWSNGATVEDPSGLVAGAYSVVVIDSQGCQATGTWTVSSVGTPGANTIQILPSCNNLGNGLIYLFAYGGTPPYSFAWTGPGGFTATTAFPGVFNISPGEYNLTMTDAMGCTFVQSYTVPAHPDVTVDAIVTPSCTEYGSGAIAATIAGGAPPYIFSWWGPDNYFSTQASISGLEAGTYYLNVFDDNDCTFYFSYEVPGASCCPADLVLPPGSSSLSLPDVVGGTVYIDGWFYVQDELIFQNATVYMGPGAEIVVVGNALLEFDGSSVTSCNGIMWKGITAYNGTTVRARNSFIDDAERLITAHDGSNLWLRNNQFHNNRVAVLVPPQTGGAYSNVTILSAYNTFYSQGPMPQPYPGQQSVIGNQGFAAFELHRTTLNLTAGWNFFHHLSNGIVAFRTDLTVYDATFQDIGPDAAYTALGNANGSGIYANGAKSWATLKHAGHGNGELSMPSFNNCRWGVYTETMNVKSWGNRMVDMGTAYRIDYSGYRDVDVFSNRVQCKRDGMDLRFNDGAAHILLDANHITFGDQPGTMRGFCGIRVDEAATANLSSVIQNNIIRHAPQSSSSFGIMLRDANDWAVLGNQVMMAHRVFSTTGIALNGCNRTTVSCNTVDSSDPLFALYPIDGQAGIRNWIGTEPLISCNNVDKTTNGILFSGWAADTDLRGNEIHDHRWGLHLEGDAIIGQQLFKGNIWHAPAPWNGFEAIYQNEQNAWNFQFWVNSSITPPNGGSYMPGSIWPGTGWFFPNFNEPNYSCEEEFACDGLGERCKGCSPELIERIADGTLENSDYTPETRWTMKGDLYKLLTEEPERMDGNPLLADFYTDVEAQVIAQIKQLEAEQLALYELAPSVSAALVQGAVQLEALRGQLQNELAALADENLTPAQQHAHVQAIEGLQAAMASLLAYHGNALELAANSRALTADGVKATNAAIATGALIEANHKAVNEVYLSTLAKDITEFTPAQAADLFEVANQCPLTGGNAVFRARAIYGLIDDDQEYDDAALCLQQGLITKNKPADAPPTCLLLPNPAKDQATLVLDAPLSEPATLLLTNALGAVALSVRVPAEQLRTELKLAGLAPGIYHYTLRGLQGTLGTGKLAVER
jgi:hypothetical protein